MVPWAQVMTGRGPSKGSVEVSTTALATAGMLSSRVVVHSIRHAVALSGTLASKGSLRSRAPIPAAASASTSESRAPVTCSQRCRELGRAGPGGAWSAA